MQKVLIIGGLGFIGWHIIKVLQAQNYAVSVLARSDKKTQTHENVEIIIRDMQTESDEDVIALLAQFDGIVFAGGADDRTMPKGDAYTFFHQENVLPSVRLVSLAKHTNIQKIVFLGSYFTYFNRSRPDWKMAERHPYVRSRVEQLTQSIAASTGKPAVIFLEIPYVFGAAPGQIPLWKPLIEYIDKSPLVFYPEGGTNVVAVENVADAVAGAFKNAKHGDCIPVAGHNMSWKELITAIATALGKKRTVITIPGFALTPVGAGIKGVFQLLGKQSGLDIYYFMEIQSSNTFLDTEKYSSYLGYQPLDLAQSFADTVAACE